MTALLNKKILLSLAAIAFVATLTVSATGAFFSDTETSTGNTFTAGDIDLKIDNTSYVTSTSTGQMIASPWTSWQMADLVAGTHKFFDFIDVKPGDIGEDTISIHVGSNDAWMCAAARITDDTDQSCTDPEFGDDPNCSEVDPNSGELDSSLNFVFWVDDGDNVYEPAEGEGGNQETIFLEGPLSGLGLQGKITLADSQTSILGNTEPIPGETTFYIGKAWCMGELTSTNLSQDGVNNVRSPLTGTGFTCDGSSVDNAAQTDRVVGDMQFYAVQSRNNPSFTCSQNYVPEWLQS